MTELEYEWDIDFSNINVDRSLPTISISTILGMIEEPFDRDRVVDLTYTKYHNDPESQYYQKTKQEIIDMWEAKGADSRHYGSMLDDYIGLNLNKKDIELKLFKLDNDYDNDKRLHGLCDSFDAFYSVLSSSGDTIFVDRERSVYHKVSIPNPDDETKTLEYYVKGRFDALFYNKRTNKWIVIDWKSSGSIDKVPTKWTKKLLGPMNKFPALNYYTYTTQLYFYKKTLVDEGYLPKGTTYDDVIVMIVNLPGKIIEECGRNFMTHQAAYKYDSDLLERLFKFGVQKDYITKKIKVDTSKEENENEEIIQENTENTNDNLINIF